MEVIKTKESFYGKIYTVRFFKWNAIIHFEETSASKHSPQTQTRYADFESLSYGTAKAFGLCF